MADRIPTRRQARPRLLYVFLRGAVAVLAFGLLAGPARAQDTPREVRAKAQEALLKGDFATAVGYLQQLVEWYGESDEDRVVAQMESVYYSLGTSLFFIGEFAEAREVFDTYLKKYRNGPHAQPVAVYRGDSFRFEQLLGQALKAYEQTLRQYVLPPDLRADVYASMVRCYLAEDKWDKAIPVLEKLYRVAPDFTRRNWAATLLTTAYLKELEVEKVYELIPFLLLPDSFASRSVALNVAALEAGDFLFAEEKYRDALWVYRLVYPHDELMVRSQRYLEYLTQRAERLKRIPDSPRPLMRVQESIGELEEEIQALAGIDNYDLELHFRIGRSYMEIFRYREAREVFVFLYEQGEGERAEEALYLAFRCSTRIQPWDRAFALGEEYMQVYPAGEYYDYVTLTMGQMYAKLEDWLQVIAVLTEALEVSPKHEEAAECMFLIGYASFMEERFADCVDWLVRMNREFPGNPREADGVYWTGMALMFDRKFEEAAVEFDAILLRYPDCPYVQDSAFRRAVCDYGAGKLKEAEERLETYVAQYPDSKLSGEGYMMLGDIAGSFGELPQAVARFQKVREYDVNIEFYNYSAFRCAEMLAELNDFQGLVDHFKDYIDRNREGSNLPLAMYWVASALWNLNEQKGALEFLRRGVAQYGADRRALGIDLTLEDWVGRSRSMDPAVAADAWQDLRDLLLKAEKENQPTLALRLKRILLFAPDATEESRAALIADILRAESIPHSSVGVLEFMMDEAEKRGQRDLAVQAAEETVAEFTETDYALSARMLLARYAIEDMDYDTAVRHLTVIREVFASSAEAADALMILGDLYIKQKKFAEADECFTSVLGVREWRGPLWPQALYGRGECARQQRNLEEACAHYERIYVLYSHYREWAAKAYLARAQCLVRLYQYRKAAETLEEMLAVMRSGEFPEVEEAQKLLDNVKRRAS